MPAGTACQESARDEARRLHIGRNWYILASRNGRARAFIIVEPDPRRAPEGKDNTEPQNAPPAAPIPENVFLILEGRKAIPLSELIFSIGRSHDNALVLDDPRVSRHHAEIRVIRDHFILFDLNSSGGTYVNGQRVGQGLLYPGDLISLAGVNLIFTQDTRLVNRNADSSGRIVGPGQRPTAVFNTSIFTRKKK